MSCNIASKIFIQISLCMSYLRIGKQAFIQSHATILNMVTKRAYLRQFRIILSIEYDTFRHHYRLPWRYITNIQAVSARKDHPGTKTWEKR